MSKGQLAPINTNQIEEYFSPKELDVVINSIAKGATNEELALFVQICKHNGLDPFKNHIYFIKYGNQMSIQVAVEGILYLAQQREDFKGVSTQLVHENDDFELELDPETQEIKIAKHTIKIPRGKVAAAYAIAKREGQPDKVVIIETDEVEHLRTKQGSQWKTYYNDMFKKHALKRALKLQFGIDVDDEQSTQDPAGSYDKRDRIDITPSEIVTGDGEVIDPEDELKKKWDEISEKMKQKGLTDDDLKNLIKSNYNKKPKELTLQQVVGLSKLIDLQKASAEDLEMSFDDFENQTLD
ncbi:recombinase RecT [Metabacillus idriensis]|uniref:RecT family recombinase n=1 Tax=Metabacillus idriensis TaxID=324768 RepID=UPI00174CF2E3|nr:RecT family recombinase [Metabacillus idriensis]MCM3598980.1 recombinase RecT [Metabacillus idriensis]